MRVAIAHDWLTGMRGGEAVLEAIIELFPKAELFTLLYIPNSVSPTISVLKRHTSFIQKIPGAARRYRYALPLFPRAIESFDLEGFDLVISSSHCVAKGIRKPQGAQHLSYVHAPMRYFWTRYEDYFGPGRASFPVRVAAKLAAPRIREWDRKSCEGVDRFVANSHFIARQIQDIYGRDSGVIHPFADLTRFLGLNRQPGRHYLMVSALVPYKRMDIAIQAFNRLRLPLLIVGQGPELNRLKKMAGPTVEFLGSMSNRTIADLYSKCRAFVFPGIEDFGITPLEAMAAGAPVIALGQGGVTETVTSETGVFFTEQTVESLIGAIERVERGSKVFDPIASRLRAQQFSKERFQREFQNEVNTLLGHSVSTVSPASPSGLRRDELTARPSVVASP